MSEIGSKIARLRRELKMSQQQLAGKEMDRSLISQIETGRCNPGPDTLRTIAQRLGKPREYFCMTAHDSETERVLVALVESAERDLGQGEPGAVEQARPKLVQALALSVSVQRQDVEGRIHLGLMRCARMAGNDAAVVEAGGRALSCLKGSEEPVDCGAIHAEIGRAALRLQDFETARRSYQQAVLYTKGRKRHQEALIASLTYLASTLFQLGEIPAAIARYREALDECSTAPVPVLRANAAMGLGWALFVSGQLGEARQWSQKALDAFTLAGSPDHVLARHNLALIDAAEGNWERAYVTLQQCLRTYEEQGRVEKQASVLEDLARYWVWHLRLEQAEETAWQALELLDAKEDGVLKGVLYRLLGTLAGRQGNVRLARAFLRMSADLLTHLKAKAEADASRAELQRLERDKRGAAAGHSLRRGLAPTELQHPPAAGGGGLSTWKVRRSPSGPGQ